MIESAVILRTENAHCRLHPSLGGAIGALSLGGTEVLRTAPETPASPLECAAFAMVPFANRVFPRTRIGTTLLDLPADPEAFPAALHGHGWRRSWDVIEVSSTRAVLGLSHDADRWPWSYAVRQELELAPDALSIFFKVSNHSDAPMPVGLGLHPYMTRYSDSFVEVAAMRCRKPDTRGLPAIPGPWPKGLFSPTAVAPCDSFLETKSASARFGRSNWSATIEVDASAGWQFYCPSGEDFYCLEPVTHLPGNIGGEAGGKMLDPGASIRWACTIRMD